MSRSLDDEPKPRPAARNQIGRSKEVKDSRGHRRFKGTLLSPPYSRGASDLLHHPNPTGVLLRALNGEETIEEGREEQRQRCCFRKNCGTTGQLTRPSPSHRHPVHKSVCQSQSSGPRSGTCDQGHAQGIGRSTHSMQWECHQRITGLKLYHPIPQNRPSKGRK